LGEVYTADKLKKSLVQSQVKPLFENNDQILQDNPKAMLLASRGATDIKKVYYALLKNFV
jgi:hypothetical protein